MHILPYVPKLAVVLLPFFLPAPSTAQNSPLNISLPLEVRFPYFNFWTTVPTSDTALSDVQYITQAFPGRTALVRIDGVTHSIFGQLSYATQTNVTGTDITPTRTIFIFQIGPIALTATFFSPIEPGDWVRQSTPFTYLAFKLKVTDGKTHDVQLYVHAVSENFFLVDAGQNITWSTVSTGLCVYEMVQLQNQQVFSENAKGQAEWGQYYLATAMSDVVTYGVGPADTLVNTFATQGSLNTVQASSLGGTSDLSTALALSRNLGNVATNATAVFAFGFVQDPAVQYVDPTGQSHRRVPYFKTLYSSIGDLIDTFIGDFNHALSRGLDLESQIALDSAEFPDDYYTTLLSMATRLVYASTVLTVGESSEGVLDPTDVMMFMKNIGAAVSANRVNPAEVLYAAFPMFMYFDADLGGPLLEPLLRSQSLGSYLQPYARLDAGTSYPNTSFTNAVHLQGVEQTANMLIMVSAYVQASGNDTLIETYHPLLKRWTEYLIGTTLFTTNQVSGDLLNINNQTNLAIKGIIAIKAMSFMSDIVGISTNYSATADTYYSRWKNLALGSDKHVLAQYGNESSWSLGYNMLADLWLQTNMISEDVFTAHVNFLLTANITPTPVTSGITGIVIPLDSLRPDNVTYDSNMFVAGFANTRLQRRILSGMESRPISNGVTIAKTTSTPWSASPDLGSVYAPFMPSLSSFGTPFSASAGSHGLSTSRKVVIALGSLFVCAFLAGVLGLLYILRRGRQPARRLKFSMLRLHRTHRRRSENSSMVGLTETPDDMMELDSIPSFDKTTSAVRARRDSGWKNLEDYDYDD